jgi:hypothetical protein
LGKRKLILGDSNLLWAKANWILDNSNLLWAKANWIWAIPICFRQKQIGVQGMTVDFSRKR